MRSVDIEPIEQFDGRLARTFDAGNEIGFDRINGGLGLSP